MHKTDFIARIAQESGLNQRVVRQVIDTALAVITRELQVGGKVVLTGFGTFAMRTRQERRGVNPRTGEEMIIPAMQTPSFQPSANLRIALGQGTAPDAALEAEEEA